MNRYWIQILATTFYTMISFTWIFLPRLDNSLSRFSSKRSHFLTYLSCLPRKQNSYETTWKNSGRKTCLQLHCDLRQRYLTRGFPVYFHSWSILVTHDSILKWSCTFNVKRTISKQFPKTKKEMNFPIIFWNFEFLKIKLPWLIIKNIIFFTIWL